MDVAHPYTGLFPALDSEILTVLAGTKRPLTGREIARLTGRESHTRALEVLNRLSEHGLVDRQEAGNALLFTLNREHLAAPPIETLVGMRLELIHRLRQTIENWHVAPIHASLFGSAARGDGDTRSDIDLFVVRPREVDDEDEVWREQLDDLATHVRRWTGNHAAISEVGEPELARLREHHPPIVEDLGRDAIVLYGPLVRALLSEAR